MEENENEEDNDRAQPPRDNAYRRLLLRLFRGRHGEDVPLPPNDVEAEIVEWDDESDSSGNTDEPQGDATNYDPTRAGEHEYLWDGENVDDYSKSLWLDEGKTHLIPMIISNIVVLPGQMMPIYGCQPSVRSTIKKAIDDGTYVALRTCFGDSEGTHDYTFHYSSPDEEIDSDPSFHGEIGTLLQVVRFADDGYVMKVHSIGRQKCRFINETRQINGVLIAGIEVVPDYDLPVFSSAFCPEQMQHFSVKKKLSISEAVSGVSSFVSKSVDTSKKCNQLAECMKVLATPGKVNASLELGPVMFSYWVASTLPVDLRTKYTFLAENSTGVRIFALLDVASKITNITCKCGSLVANLWHVINMNTEGSNSQYVNNSGYNHEMITVVEAQNFLQQGIPSSQFSWFPGYKWQIIVCRQCHNHLGWEFTSRKFLPAKFYGITRQGVRPQARSLEQDGDR